MTATSVLHSRRRHGGEHATGAGGGRIAAALRTAGEILITAGVVLLLFVVYELYITGIATAQSQTHLEHQLSLRWVAPVPVAAGKPSPAPGTVQPAPLGAGLAIVRSPRLGKSWHWVIDEGVATADLAKGPGHYPGTALPGQLGNFVVSGHRTTHGAPFFNADALRAGDAIVLETRDSWFVYRVTGETVVDPTDVGVILPVPGRPGAQPTQKLLTFTTCNPRYSASQRLIVHGELAAQQLKSAGEPTALRTGQA